MPVELNDSGGARELAMYRISVAKEDLASAEQNFAQGQYRTANNRAYYAIFRAISACLSLKFKAYKSHAQVIGNFNKEFIHTGIFSRDMGKKINHAQEIRHASDYNDFYIVSIEEAKEQLVSAQEIVAEIDAYLQQLP